MTTIAELLESFKVYAVCIECARMEHVAIETLDPDMSIEALRARLRCSSCGMRRQDLRIVYVGPCERAAAFRYRR